MAINKYVIFSLLLALTALACTETAPVARVNATPEGVAIKGYDPVAYFTEQKPVAGSAEFEYIWNGSKWRFATAEHRDHFKADPEKYTPQYGGYCAYAVSQGKTADIDPEAWTVLNGKLYLNLNKDVQRLWDRKRKDFIRKADENWPRMLGKKRRP
ncbi:MAG: YHS domain protein [Nitrospiraceae bacterium]|nr:MAG: YHS domain protein [Nitrospiraceae bacterium]